MLTIRSQPTEGVSYLYGEIPDIDIDSQIDIGFSISIGGSTIYSHTFVADQGGVLISGIGALILSSLILPDVDYVFSYMLNEDGDMGTAEFFSLTAKRNKILSLISGADNGLSSEYGDVVIAAEVSVTVEISFEGNLILSEKYTPDSEGNITIQKLGKIAESLFSRSDFLAASGVEGSSLLLSLSATDGDNILNKDITFYFCLVDFSGSLDVDLLKLIPLSRMTKKITGPGRKEYVSFYGNMELLGYAVKKGIIQDESISFSFGDFDFADKIQLIDVSPEVIATLAGCSVSDLIYYDVYKSLDAIIKFTMDQRNYPVKRTFIFRNCFGAQEAFTCIGDEESSRKWTREYGVQNDSQLQISRDLVNSIKVNTGPVTSQMVEALEDLLNTDQLAVLDEYGFQPIVILEENFTNNSRRDTLRSFDFTYRFARNNQFRTTYAAFKKPRVFDATFDQTFE